MPNISSVKKESFTLAEGFNLWSASFIALMPVASRDLLEEGEKEARSAYGS